MDKFEIGNQLITDSWKIAEELEPDNELYLHGMDYTFEATWD